MTSKRLSVVQLAIPKHKKLAVEFQNLTFFVRSGLGKKQILNGISGSFKAGELTAIMGPSGAGKSTLLNVLTGFQKNGVEGTVKRVSAHETRKKSGKFRKDSCYILQDDQLNPLFTVSEIMAMAADLKLGYALSPSEKEQVIEEILNSLSLSVCKETRCERLSGGQKKRLSIALELIDNPPVMFLDEPTTGLDSLSSFQCISTLKDLARGGRTVICTIHQPSATIFEMFDQIYVLAEGYCIYRGPAPDTVPYLANIGLNCPQYHNPADFLLEIANGDYGDFTKELVDYAQKTLMTYDEPNCKSTNILDNIIVDTLTDAEERDVVPPTELWRFWILLKRTCLQLYRDWTVTHLRLALHTIIGILLGLLYLNYGSDGSKTIQNTGYFVVSCAYISYTSMMPAVLKFPSELPVLRKERFNNWYKLNTYYLAFLVTHIPIQVVYALAYTSVSYFLTSQPADLSRFAMFVVVCCLVSIASEGLGIIFGTTVNPVNGTFLGAILTALMLCVAGFLCLYPHMSTPMYLLSYGSYIAYGVDAMVHAMYGFSRPALPCPDDKLFCMYRVPDSLMKEFGMDEGNYWHDIACLVGIVVLFRVVGFYTLRKQLS